MTIHNALTAPDFEARILKLPGMTRIRLRATAAEMPGKARSGSESMAKTIQAPMGPQLAALRPSIQ